MGGDRNYVEQTAKKSRDRLYRGTKTDPRTLLAKTNRLMHMMIKQLEEKGRRRKGKKREFFSSTDVDMIVKLNAACRNSSKYADSDDKEIQKQLGGMTDAQLREEVKRRLLKRPGHTPPKDREKSLPQPEESTEEPGDDTDGEDTGGRGDESEGS